MNTRVEQTMHNLRETMAFWELTWDKLLLGLLVFVVTSAGGMALVTFLLVKLPATYFRDGYRHDLWLNKYPIVHWTGRIVKNALGVALVFLGLILSLPGIPGPGVLMILLGVMLVNFP